MSHVQWRIKQFLKFYNEADSLFTIHSPFAFKLLEKALDRTKTYYDFERIELLRNEFLKNEHEIRLIDFGTGRSESSKRIKKIASHSLSSPRQCQEMYRIIEHLKPKKILELGSCLGISSAYLASAHPKSQVISFEGDPSLCKIARETTERLKLFNIKFIQGSFSSTMKTYIDSEDFLIDFAFLDGNHTYHATLQYFNLLRPKLHQASCCIIDDIYWSPGMKKAWDALKKLSEVTLSIDRFDFGILLFRKEIKEPVHLKVIDQVYKPWKKTL